MSFRKTVAIVNQANLAHNLKQLKAAAGAHFFCPMIKADAYGHGAVASAKILLQNGVRRMGVALVEEALELRSAGLSDAEIYVFGPFQEDAAPAIVHHRLIPVLSRWDQIESLEKILTDGASFPVHLKFNTGMNRLGFDVEDAERVQVHMSQSKKLALHGLCTHLAIGEDAAASDGMTSEQSKRFATVATIFGSASKTEFHLYNSSGFLSRFGSQDINEGFRPGISLYGEPPVDTELSLRPVMTLQTEIIMIHSLRVNESVSYGARWTAERPSTVAVVAIGYADGLSRQFSNHGAMLYRGIRVPIIGTVCMDYTLIDLTDAVKNSAPHIGEEVVVFGEQRGQYLSASECAAMIGTISYEIFTSVSRRVPRVYR